MARKSKYEPSSAKLSTALWKPALYIRLSREDGDREESNSIASQRELLTEFANTQTDMAAPRLYTDATCIIGTNQSPREWAAICPYFSFFQNFWGRQHSG